MPFSAGTFPAGAFVVISTILGGTAIRVTTFVLSSGTATLQAEYNITLHSGSLVGADYLASYIPYLAITSASDNFLILSERYFLKNVTTWSYGSGTWNFANSLNYYY